MTKTEPPSRVVTPTLVALRAGLDPRAVSQNWPVIDPPTVDGVPVTFAVRAAPGKQVLLHLRGITDALRTDLSWALLPEVCRDANGSTYASAYLLPSALICGYRVLVADHLDPDAGATRSGWLSVQQAGVPDPLGTTQMRTPSGSDSTLLALPGARVHPAWAPDADPRLPEPSVTRLTDRASVWDYGRRDAAVVLFDAEQWSEIGLPDRLRRLDTVPLVIAVESEPGQRSSFLPYPDAVAAVVRDALAVLDARGVRLRPRDLLATGQSYGGLAALGLALDGLAAGAFAQSTSLYYVPGRGRPQGEPVLGELVQRVARDSDGGARFAGRVELVAGTHEPGLLHLAREAEPILSHAGIDVSVDAVVGGHDYAWWRHELMFRLGRPTP